MSNTTKTVLIVSGVFLACIIAIVIIFSTVVRGTDGIWNWRDLVGGEEFAIDESEAFDLSGVKEIEVDCVSGDITLIPSEETKATLTGTVIGSSKDQDYLEVYTEGETLVVKVDYKNRWLDWNVNMDLNVYLPADNMLALDVDTSSGDINIDGFTFGQVNILKTSGDARVKNCSAESIVYESTSGDTDISGCEADVLTIISSSGNIDVNNTPAEITVRSTSGNTSIQNADGIVDVGSTSGNVTVSMADETISEVVINITSGNAKLYLEPNTAFDFEGKTTSGNIKSDIDISVRGTLGQNFVGDDVKGTANGGGPLVYMQATSGNVSIIEK